MIKHHVRSASIAIAVALGMFSACATTQDEPTVDESTDVTATTESSDITSPEVSTQGFQIVFQCFTPSGGRVGLPKSPLSACQAACPAPDYCQRCVWQNQALDCGE